MLQQQQQGRPTYLEAFEKLQLKLIRLSEGEVECKEERKRANRREKWLHRGERRRVPSWSRSRSIIHERLLAACPL